MLYGLGLGVGVLSAGSNLAGGGAGAATHDQGPTKGAGVTSPPWSGAAAGVCGAGGRPVTVKGTS